MLPTDTLEEAEHYSRTMVHTCSRHFYDATQGVGNTVAKSLGYAGQTAWDTYLFYSPGSEWDILPPQPSAWVHQLSGQLDPDRLRWREQLSQTLEEIMKNAADSF